MEDSALSNVQTETNKPKATFILIYIAYIVFSTLKIN